MPILYFQTLTKPTPLISFYTQKLDTILANESFIRSDLFLSRSIMTLMAFRLSHRSVGGKGGRLPISAYSGTTIKSDSGSVRLNNSNAELLPTYDTPSKQTPRQLSSMPMLGDYSI